MTKTEHPEVISSFITTLNFAINFTLGHTTPATMAI
jgi:hypothetical protein